MVILTLKNENGRREMEGERDKLSLFKTKLLDNVFHNYLFKFFFLMSKLPLIK